MTLRDLNENEISPLKVVQQLINQPSWYLDDKTNDRLVYELRLFGAMFNRTLREHLNLVFNISRPPHEGRDPVPDKQFTR
jgi:hypothetical protein